MSGRGQAGSGSVSCNSSQSALLHDHCVLSTAERKLSCALPVLLVVIPFIFSTSERRYRESTQCISQIVSTES